MYLGTIIVVHNLHICYNNAKKKFLVVLRLYSYRKTIHEVAMTPIYTDRGRIESRIQ